MVTYVESTISLGIQIVVFALLIGAILMKNQKKYRQHGIIMLSAVALHWISILVVMIPSFANFFSVSSAIDFASPIVVITFVHVFAGFIAAFLGTWLVGSWRLKTDLQTCFRKKRVMDVTFGFWSLAIFLGIILYLAIIQVI
jgi:uncharacterized membrane protein YozB (DUF420 family)